MFNKIENSTICFALAGLTMITLNTSCKGRFEGSKVNLPSQCLDKHERLVGVDKASNKPSYEGKVVTECLMKYRNNITTTINGKQTKGQKSFNELTIIPIEFTDNKTAFSNRSRHSTDRIRNKNGSLKYFGNFSLDNKSTEEKVMYVVTEDFENKIQPIGVIIKRTRANLYGWQDKYVETSYMGNCNFNIEFDSQVNIENAYKPSNEDLNINISDLARTCEPKIK
jgi:hypothetical protein